MQEQSESTDLVSDKPSDPPSGEPSAKPAGTSSSSASSTSSSKPSAEPSGGGGASKKLTWAAGSIGAVLLAVAVGVGVYLYTGYAHRQSVDGQVQQQVATQVAAAKEQMQQGPPPTKVRVATVGERVMQLRIPIVGRLMEVRRTTVASEVEGKVLKLLTPAGREVVGGKTVIAKVDPVWSRLSEQQAEADLAAAQATVARSKRELERLEALAQRSAADPQALDDARSKVEADQASVLARKAQLARTQVAVKRVDIIAPFDGIVTRKLTEEGQWLSPGAPVVEVLSRGLIDAVIDVPEQYISVLKKGTPVSVTVEALGQTIAGKVQAINPDGSNPARTYPVKIRIDDQGGKLKVGMSVTAMVPAGVEKKQLVVPVDAVQLGENSKQVWMSVKMPGSPMPKAMPMDVAVLYTDESGKFMAVQPKPKDPTMTLRAGKTQVVIEGAERLWPMRPMIVMPPAGEKPPTGKQAKK